MAINNLQVELQKINQIIPKIEKYDGKSLDVVPDDIKRELSQIKIIPPFTASGLEKVNRFINNLYIGKYIIEGKIKKRTQVVKKTEGEKPEIPSTDKQSVDMSRPTIPRPRPLEKKPPEFIPTTIDSVSSTPRPRKKPQNY